MFSLSLLVALGPRPTLAEVRRQNGHSWLRPVSLRRPPDFPHAGRVPLGSGAGRSLCWAEFISGNIKIYLYFLSFISQHRDRASSWFFWWQTKICLSCIFSTADDLALNLGSQLVRDNGSRLYHQHIEAMTKWQPFCRWHFLIHFLLWKLLYFDSNFTEICSKGSSWQ